VSLPGILGKGIESSLSEVIDSPVGLEVLGPGRGSSKSAISLVIGPVYGASIACLSKGPGKGIASRLFIGIGADFALH